VLCSEAEQAVAQAHARMSDSPSDTTQDSSTTAGHPEPDSLSDRDVAAGATGQAEQIPTDAREEARRAARRIVAFGWHSQGVDEDRPVQAVQNGKQVETSFAKGEWGIQWRRFP
jgi:hypothetical protein